MTDLDIIRHFRCVIGLPNHRIGCSRSKHKNHSDCFRLRFGPQTSLDTLLAAIAGRLFERRHDKLNEVLNTSLTYTQPKLTLPWLAGYLDGEAYFRYYNTARITVKCTDYDVLCAVQAFVGVGSIRPRKKPNPNYVPPNGLTWNAHKHKQQWVWDISGENARTWMRKLYPMLGVWRQFQIRRALSKNQLDVTIPVSEQERMLGLV